MLDCSLVPRPHGGVAWVWPGYQASLIAIQFCYCTLVLAFPYTASSSSPIWSHLAPRVSSGSPGVVWLPYTASSTSPIWSCLAPRMAPPNDLLWLPYMASSGSPIQPRLAPKQPCPAPLYIGREKGEPKIEAPLDPTLHSPLPLPLCRYQQLQRAQDTSWESSKEPRSGPPPNPR